MAKVYGHRECKSLEEVVTKKEFDGHAHENITGVLDIEHGGTNSRDAASARKALGITLANLGAAKAEHTHSYAGSPSAGGAANSANKLNTNAGAAGNPVYFKNGVPVACNKDEIRTEIGIYYALNKLGITTSEADLETIHQAMQSYGRIVINSASVTGAPSIYGTIIIDKWGYRGVARYYRQDSAEWCLSCRNNSGEWSPWLEYDDNSAIRPITAGGTGANNKWDALINLGLVVNNGRALFATGTTASVIFETPFTQIPSVILTAEGPTGALYATNVSKTGFTIHATGAGGNANYTGYVNWLAITREKVPMDGV